MAGRLPTHGRVGRWWIALVAMSLLLPTAGSVVHADEHFFGWIRGTETLPGGHLDFYQFTTMRTGKDAGTYRAFDFDTEIEYGITNRLQVSASVVNRYIYNKGVPDLDDTDSYRFGGVEGAVKYNILSPFKEKFGLSARMEIGFLRHDEVDGLREKEFFVAPEVLLQKNFLDDTLIFQANVGFELAWGKMPAEQYDHELAIQGGVGVVYRFAPNWFFGLEAHTRSEWPSFDLGNFEHMAVFAGPTLHYGARRWWATLSYGYQIYGHGVDENFANKTFAEEARHEVRLKIGLNY